MALDPKALSTLAAFQALGSAQAALSSTRAEALINGASDSIVRFCGREFHRQVGKVEDVAAYDSSNLRLALTPIETLTSIVFDGVAVDIAGVTIDAGAGLLYRPEGWAWTASIARAIREYALPGSEAKVVRVTYTGGYALPQNNRTPGIGLPYDLEEACLALATYRMSMTPKNQGLSAEQAGNASRSFSGGKAPDLPDYIVGMLEGYARVR